MLDKKKYTHAENKISSSDQFFLHEIQGLSCDRYGAQYCQLKTGTIALL